MTDEAAGGRGKTPRTRRGAASCGLLAMVLACGGREEVSATSGGPPAYTNVPPPADGVAEFTVAPIDLTRSGSVTALGHLGGGGHVEPTPHAYLYAWDLLTGDPNSTLVQTVRVPATAAVFFTLAQHGDWKVGFRATQDFYFYLDHVMLQTPPAIGTVFHAGDVLGETAPGGTLDVGALDATVTLAGFVNPDRYTFDELHCVTPWKYFAEPIKSQLYARIYRAPTASLDQRIDQDVAGTLAGTWFEQSLPAVPSIVESPTGWPLTISFAEDEYDGVTPRVSLGGWAATASNVGFPSGGVWAVPSSIASWTEITPNTGVRAIPLNNLHGTDQQGLLLVQMVDEGRMELEIWSGAPAVTAFDSGARIYVR